MATVIRCLMLDAGAYDQELAALRSSLGLD